MTDVFDHLQEIGDQEERSKKNKRKRRAERCGWPYEFVDPHNGTLRKATYICNVPEYCYACAERRAEREKLAVSWASGGEAVMTVEDTEKAVNSLKRSLKRKGVESRRYPLAGGSAFLIHMGDESHGGQRKALNEIDWMRITQQPPGKNISGKLRQPVKPAAPEKADGDSKLIKVPTIRYLGEEPEPEVRQQAWELAVLATSHLDPDLDTLRDCIDERLRVYRKEIRRLGGQVGFFVWHPVLVHADEIDWGPHNRAIQKICKRKQTYHSGLHDQLPENYIEKLLKGEQG